MKVGLVGIEPTTGDGWQVYRMLSRPFPTIQSPGNCCQPLSRWP
jgi:hypothetical protein